MYKAKIRKKSDCQKDNCIGWLYGCEDESVNEAFYGMAAVRCCKKEKCELFAIRIATDYGKNV